MNYYIIIIGGLILLSVIFISLYKSNTETYDIPIDIPINPYGKLCSYNGQGGREKSQTEFSIKCPDKTPKDLRYQQRYEQISSSLLY